MVNMGENESIGSMIVWFLLIIIGFFMMLIFLSYIPSVVPSDNQYRGWIPLIILVAYVLFVYVGYKKAKRGELI